MVIRAVVFDIGGVLEVTPDLGVDRLWETKLGLPAGDLNLRMRDVWRGGSIGTITSDDVHEALRDRLGLDDHKLAQFMADLWREYLGTANTELIEYACRLRPRYRTGIVSNSFVGAREREQATAATPGPQGQQQIAAAFRAAFPDLRWHVDLMLAEGDLVAARWTASGTNTGGWAGQAATGKPATFSGVNIFRIRDGKVAEIWNHRDDLGLAQQLGAPVYAGAPPQDD